MRISVLQGGNYIFLVALFFVVALLELFLAGTGFGRQGLGELCRFRFWWAHGVSCIDES